MIAFLLLLLLFVIVVLPKEQTHEKHPQRRKHWDDLNEAEEKLEEMMLKSEFLTGHAHWVRYMVGAIAVVLFLTTCGGCMIMVCRANFTCCLCFGSLARFVFRGLRAICCFWRQPVEYGCWKTYAPFANDFEHADSACERELVPVVNSRNVRVVVPYCQRHGKMLRDHIFTEDRRWEANATYPLNIHFGDAPAKLDIPKLVAEELSHVSTNREDGFIYLFHNIDDTRIVRYPPASPEEPYLFKIGKTTRTTKERLSEWPGAVKDAEWATARVAAAEPLIHTLLAQQRISRFNVSERERKFENEWFYATRREIEETVRRVLAAIKANRLDDLKQI